jgi:hypothetical protein
VNDNAKVQAEAAWLWPMLCIGTLWSLGLLLSSVWLLTWLGAAVAGFVILVMALRAKRKGWVAALWGGGYALCGTALAVWILVLTVVRIY